MKVLVIGGSGHVGSLTLPILKQHHTLRVFDLRPPADATLEYVAGDVTDYDALLKASQNMEALIYMAMGSLAWDTLMGITTAFDVNVKGVYLALKAAHAAGISHAVYTSTMSVYKDPLQPPYYYPDEDVPPDARHFYGLTKRFGEEICRVAARDYSMSVNALRLCYPQDEEKWLAETKAGVPTIATTGPDVARALLAALDFRCGFQAFMISGDYEHKIMNMQKAKCLLGWAPLARPRE
ncbi:MAG: NAD(P)-dependent oxidoreductase [Anaerolineae bacterium]|nr:NAD(P)-dependent oxidoreductase [Thermoflexales bacterium]MDW8408090.1 NAD(P)-dependent oxidoreductase [Anaerolineae bacterium]